MGAFRYLIVFLTAAIIISACQKVITTDNLIQASGNLLKTPLGDCAPVTLGGSYVQNTALVTTNFMEVQVNFTAPGDYEIKSDTVNGYSFKAAGQAITGVNVVRLAASGTPISAGTNVFSIRFDTSICQANVVVSSSVAVFTFGNTAGTCTGAIVAGTYNTGLSLTTSNTASIQVNVSSPGAYSITTNVVNGMSFSRSGIFTTGPQTVSLTGSGIPAVSGSFTFNTMPTGGCTFVVPVVNPSGSLAQLTTAPTTGITCTTVISGGNITNDGGSVITARGVCYSTAANPTTAQPVINSGSGTGGFTSNINGLTAGTTYHVRAFATNTAGTAYGNDIPFTTSTGCQVNIYVSGRDDVYNISGNIPNPKLWVKTTGSFTGTALPFTAGAYDSDANSVFATATDVYVAGRQNSTATLWKNGVLSQLAPTPGPPVFITSDAYGVYVAGTDVYVAGVSEGYKATIWKNGVATVLANNSSQAIAVFVSGTDVYAAGYEGESIGNNYVYRAKVWKNGIALTLSGSTADARANAVFVAGTDVYVAGKEGNAAKLWKNGVASTLPSGSNTAVANSIFVAGTDVYIAGTEDDGNAPRSFAKIWKNGIGSYITPTSQTHNRATSVYVVGSNVYIAGSIGDIFANTRAAVWINNVLTPLTSGSTDAYAYSIFVR